MLNRVQLMEFARDVDNVDQVTDLFGAYHAAEKKLHRDVWDAITDDPASIRVETRGRSTGRRDHKGIPDGPIAFTTERTEKDSIYIKIDTFHEGRILIYVNEQLKIEKPGNRVLVSSLGCF